MLLLVPSRAVAQCANIAGNWNATESGNMTITISAEGESDSETDPISGSGAVTITKTGTCTFQYLPVGFSTGSGLLGSGVSLVRTVKVSGNKVTESGVFVIIDTAAAAQLGMTITSVNPNLYSGTGTDETNENPNVIMVNASGNTVVTGTVPDQNNNPVPFTLTITASTTATFTGATLPPIQITPPDQTGIAAGLTYNGQFSATGGNGAPYTWCVLSGAGAAGSACIPAGTSASPLPAGFSMNSAGLLKSTGTPPASQGTYNFTVQATDSGGLQQTQAFTLTIGCPTNVNLFFGGRSLPVVSGSIVMPNSSVAATFTPPNSNQLLSAYAQACGYSGGFDWMQTVIQDTTPPIVDQLGATLEVPYSDPPYGGYTYQFPTNWPVGSQAYEDAELFLAFQPNFATAYPFYYNPLDINTSSCAAGSTANGCLIPITDGSTLRFYDAPQDSHCSPPAQCLGFRTRMVGICNGASQVCDSSGPSNPLFQWTWYSNYNGTVGGIYQEGPATVLWPDQGSGTGGITITSINGVPTPTVTATPSATNLTTAQALKVAVTVKGATATPVPTGSVTLSSGSYTSSAATLTNGAATIAVPAGSLAAGSDTLTVAYAPDKSSLAVYSVSTASAEVTVTIPLLTPTVTVTPSLTSLTTGQALSVTVGVSGASGNPVPTGTVTVSGGGYNSAIASLSEGTATINIAAGALSVGTDTLTADYSPDTSSSGIYYSATGSATVKVAKQTPAATPTFSPAAGTFTSIQTVSIKDATAGASIFYTTDGTAPTTASAQYSAPLTVSATETIKAIATASGYATSAAASATYTINLPTAATPSFSPAAGTFTAVQTVKLACTTKGASIYYTLDGSTPTTASAQYSAALPVNQTTTIKAIAAAASYKNSAVASATYTIDLPAATPSFTPAAGTYISAQTVTLADATSGAILYYTTNGTTPTLSSAKYTTAGIKVSATETVKAIATAAGYSTSAVASATYTIATAPAVTTKAATGLTASGATLNGAVIANNAATQYWFVWGTSKNALTNSTTMTGAITGTTPTAVTAPLTGLKTKTTYYFQLVASNAAGTTNGTVLSFTTN
jgi:hypothetical protein